MRLPKIVRTPDGWLTGYAFWTDESIRGRELCIKSWVAHPQIEAKLKEDAEIWKNSWTLWEQRHSLSRWQ